MKSTLSYCRVSARDRVRSSFQAKASSRSSGRNPNSVREPPTTPWCELPRAFAGCWSGRGASRSNHPDPQCDTPSTADIPVGARAPAAVPRPSPSSAADPNPAAPRAATTPHRSSVEPSPQTPPGKSAGSVISNWHRGDILIGRLQSMLAHGRATQNMPLREFMGNLTLLIVGGNDTTRNSMTGGLYALSQHPHEYQKLRDNPALIASLVPEIIRYVTPVIHMRRTATHDADLGGQHIRAGDKVVMWYVSGNRDPDAIEDPDNFIIDRPRPRQHLSFGFGIHRCVGNRLAELQLRILWEELLPRHPVIEVLAAPRRTYSNFIHGMRSMPVRIPMQ